MTGSSWWGRSTGIRPRSGAGVPGQPRSREAKLLASLSHPGIAIAHGLHEERGVRFLAMELVPGEDLARRLTRGPLPLYDVLAIAGELAAALEAAHERGVIHRDLKPANIRLTQNGFEELDD